MMDSNKCHGEVKKKVAQKNKRGSEAGGTGMSHG